MGFNNGKIALYDISYLKFEGDILEVDNVFKGNVFHVYVILMMLDYILCLLIQEQKSYLFKILIIFLFNYYKSYFNCSF